jgi:hypothetical protein
LVAAASRSAEQERAPSARHAACREALPARLAPREAARTRRAGLRRAGLLHLWLRSSPRPEVVSTRACSESLFTHRLAPLVPIRGFFRWLTRQNYLLYNPASELERKPASNPVLPSLNQAANAFPHGDGAGGGEHDEQQIGKAPGMEADLAGAR